MLDIAFCANIFAACEYTINATKTRSAYNNIINSIDCQYFWRDFLKICKKVLTFAHRGAIIYRQCGSPQRSQYAGMAELADARDLKSREILSRTGSTPASGTIYIAEWSSLVARRAHNPKVMRFKSHLRNQRKPYYLRIVRFFLCFLP